VRSKNAHSKRGRTIEVRKKETPDYKKKAKNKLHPTPDQKVDAVSA